MNKKKQDEIERKLKEIEISLKSESSDNLPAATGSKSSLARVGSESSNKEKESRLLKAELYMLGGITALSVGLLMLFNHLQVVSFNWLPWSGGAHGSGFLLLLFIIGLGVFFYDYKNKVGWLLVISSLTAMIVSAFMSMQLVFPAMPLLGLLMLFIPTAFGCALVAKALKMRREAGAPTKN